MIVFLGFLIFSKKISDILLIENRPDNIPENSLFAGGKWLELVEKVDNYNYRFKIYQRGSGELKIDAIFTLSDPLCIKSLDSTNIYNSIRYYDRAILLKENKNFKSLECQMTPTEIYFIEDPPDGIIELEEKK